MNKKEFDSELKELMSSMTEEEIKKTIGLLDGCRALKSRKLNYDKGELTRLSATADPYGAELGFIHQGQPAGRIYTMGASLLTEDDYMRFEYVIPTTQRIWWLYNGKQAVGNKGLRPSPYDNDMGSIRPVLIIGEINGELVPGDAFSVSNERFKLLSPSLAIRTDPLDEKCTFRSFNYETSALRFFVNGWYAELVRKNKPQRTGENGVG